VKDEYGDLLADSHNIVTVIECTQGQGMLGQIEYLIPALLRILQPF
jgi:hypothetical protein